jgi:hypothetical protein
MSARSLHRNCPPNIICSYVGHRVTIPCGTAVIANRKGGALLVCEMKSRVSMGTSGCGLFHSVRKNLISPRFGAIPIHPTALLVARSVFRSGRDWSKQGRGIGVCRDVFKAANSDLAEQSLAPHSDLHRRFGQSLERDLSNFQSSFPGRQACARPARRPAPGGHLES